MLKDSISEFELYQPADVDNVLDLLDRFGENSWILAGGYDSLDWFKNRGKNPKAIIDIAGVEELRGVREIDGFLEIGSLTTLTEIERNPLIKDRFGLLAQAAGKVASPQIRNAATLGGNLCQDTRCWYYRYGLNCYRAEGNTCYASGPDALNREHALFGANRCVAVTPSDTAPALVVLDAEMVVRNLQGEHTIAAEEFFMDPAVDLTRMTVMESGDLLTSIRIPKDWAGKTFYFEKVTDRNSWDFALVSIAGAFIIQDGLISDLRMACGGVQCIPRRLQGVEDFVRGKANSENITELAAEISVTEAEALNKNHFKIPLMKNLVKRALRDLE
ncbi:MAG: molybdopterin dehydrogenase [Gemmatimonadetes bacterium]|nr:molybdopterin dehydrogenase [Gemmatimonadota bacterium]